jgi:hypothetical protein
LVTDTSLLSNADAPAITAETKKSRVLHCSNLRVIVANRLEPQPPFFRYADRALCEKADVFCTEDDGARGGLKDAGTSSAKRSRIFIPESEKIEEVASVESGSMPLTKSERPAN